MIWSETPRIEIFCADCMDHLPGYPDNFFDLAITDPPYGNGRNDFINKTGGTIKAKRTVFKKVDWNNSPPPAEYFEHLKRISKNQLIFGGNFFGLAGGYIVWNKEKVINADAELIYNSFSQAVKIYKYTWNGFLQEDRKNPETRIHPTQKPVNLYKYFLHKYGQPGQTIIDTHTGSGSIAIACHEMGFNLIGFEIDPDNYADSHKRFKQYKAQLKLFG